MNDEQPRGPGGQFGNLSNTKKVSIDIKEYDLRTVDGCFRLLQRIAEAALHGEISSRTHGSLNNTIRIILTYHSDIEQVAENKRVIEESKRRIKELEQKLDEREQCKLKGEN